MRVTLRFLVTAWSVLDRLFSREFDTLVALLGMLSTQLHLAKNLSLKQMVLNGLRRLLRNPWKSSSSVKRRKRVWLFDTTQSSILGDRGNCDVVLSYYQDVVAVVEIFVLSSYPVAGILIRFVRAKHDTVCCRSFVLETTRQQRLPFHPSLYGGKCRKKRRNTLRWFNIWEPSVDRP
eukprot:scaffold7995_cov173-Amphora_coffeaeformis.AAC.10